MFVNIGFEGGFVKGERVELLSFGARLGMSTGKGRVTRPSILAGKKKGVS